MLLPLLSSGCAIIIIIIIIIILDWGPVPLFAPWKHCSQSGLLYDSPFSKRSYSGRQVPLASTTRGSPLAARGGTMGEKWWPNGAWDIHPRFFYVPQICEMGTIILRPFRRKACLGFFNRPLKFQQLRPGLNPRTWVSEASTLPLHHQSRTRLCKLISFFFKHF